MDVWVILAGAVLGVLAGALMNAVVHRIPRGVVVAWPPPAPGFRVSLLAALLPGVRRGSGAHVVVELLMGAVFAAVTARIGWDWALPAFLLFAWTIVCVAIIDANTRKIPNRLTYPLTPALAVLLVVAALLAGEPGWALRALLGGLLAFVSLLAMAVFRPGSMGMGDVKLAGFIGLGLGYLGWAHVVLGLVSAFLIGGVVAIVLMSLRARARKDLLPFGPYLAAGALLSVTVGGPLLAGYSALLVR